MTDKEKKELIFVDYFECVSTDRRTMEQDIATTNALMTAFCKKHRIRLRPLAKQYVPKNMRRHIKPFRERPTIESIIQKKFKFNKYQE